MKMLLSVLLIPLLATGDAPKVLATGDAPKNPVSWKVVGGGAERTITAGKTVDVVLEADIVRGWHIYSLTQKPGGPIPLRIQLVGAADVGVRGGIKSPKPVTKFDRNFGIETELHAGKPRFTIPLGVPAGVPTGKRELEIAARYQACSETLCHPARTARLALTLRIRAAG